MSIKRGSIVVCGVTSNQSFIDQVIAVIVYKKLSNTTYFSLQIPYRQGTGGELSSNYRSSKSDSSGSWTFCSVRLCSLNTGFL